jgi:hypothetical protein
VAAAATIIWRVTPSEHVRAVGALQAYHARQERRLVRELRVIALATLALAGIAVIAWRWWTTGHPPLELLIGIGVPALLVEIYIHWRRGSVARAARRQLEKNPLTLQERRYTFDGRGLSVAGETFEDKFGWREVKHIAETPEFFLIFAARSAYYLPKRAVTWPETIENLREVLAEYLGDRARVR